MVPDARFVLAIGDIANDRRPISAGTKKSE